MRTSKRFLAIMSGLLSASVVFFLGYAAGGKVPPHAPKPPSRPQGVPEGAAWAGGPDGGVWIHCASARDPGSTAVCAVFADSTGVEIERGLFEINFESMQFVSYSSSKINVGAVVIQRKQGERVGSLP